MNGDKVPDTLIPAALLDDRSLHETQKQDRLKGPSDPS